VSFQVEIGAPLREAQEQSVAARLIDIRDVRPGTLWLGHLAGRGLSVAASRFAEQVGRDLEQTYSSI